VTAPTFPASVEDLAWSTWVPFLSVTAPREPVVYMIRPAGWHRCYVGESGNPRQRFATYRGNSKITGVQRHAITAMLLEDPDWARDCLAAMPEAKRDVFKLGRPALERLAPDVRWVLASPIGFETDRERERLQDWVKDQLRLTGELWNDR